MSTGAGRADGRKLRPACLGMVLCLLVCLPQPSGQFCFCRARDYVFVHQAQGESARARPVTAAEVGVNFVQPAPSLRNKASLLASAVWLKLCCTVRIATITCENAGGSIVRAWAGLSRQSSGHCLLAKSFFWKLFSSFPSLTNLLMINDVFFPYFFSHQL